MKQLIAGNWKMNLVSEQVVALVEQIQPSSHADVLICPAFPYLSLARHILTGSSILLGAQDCHDKEKGAYTGDVSPLMLHDIGCDSVILGHSERRQYHQEKDELIHEKAQTVISVGLVPMICIGETDEENKKGLTEEILSRQIKNSIPNGLTGQGFVLAYEPVWAIGTGRTPTLEEIAKVHSFIRKELGSKSESAGDIRILYGGSVNGDNASEILHCKNVDGVLVGGASLKAEEFNKIVAGVRV